tara:strand:+ start:3189 stop:3827 length:639 start_codon:yes stop_codon:yes gene_type:complete
MLFKTENLLKYIKTPYSIYVAQIHSSFQNILSEDYNIRELDLFKLRSHLKSIKIEFKKIDIHEKVLYSHFFQYSLRIITLIITECLPTKYSCSSSNHISDLNSKYDLEEISNMNNLTDNVLKFIKTLQDVDHMTNEIYENELEKFEIILESFENENSNVYCFSPNNNINTAFVEICVALYGILESFNSHLIDIKWDEVIIDHEKIIAISQNY